MTTLEHKINIAGKLLKNGLITIDEAEKKMDEAIDEYVSEMEVDDRIEETINWKRYKYRVMTRSMMQKPPVVKFRKEWVTFSKGGKVLCEMTAKEATIEEVRSVIGLLAYANNCKESDIVVKVVDK